MKIAVLISGGVDSSVALRLLKDQGHTLTAFYLKIWLEDELQYLGKCPWGEDLKYVQEVCSSAGVSLEVLPMQREYWDRVVSYTVAECKAGRTPNPDILCNQQIKFGQFYEKIDASFDKAATGHYAQVEEKDGVFHLMRSSDPVKDQTYFLAALSQKQLSRALFPIGQYTKKEVRTLAKKYNLPNQNRKDSQGICFLGKVPYREFIRHHLGENPGDFVEISSGLGSLSSDRAGKIIGEHKGYWFYTIGQRYGLGLSGGPWFVVKKDIEKNVIYLANGYMPEEVYGKGFEAENINWIRTERRAEKQSDQYSASASLKCGQYSASLKCDQYSASASLKCERQLCVKIRHGAAMHPCAVNIYGASATVTLQDPIHGIAPGQFAVFYEGQECLGGGKIQ